MNARQQLARLLPLAVLVLLALVGLRGGIAWHGTLDGPLRRYGVVVGIVLEVILGTLLILAYNRERAAHRGGPEQPPAEAADRDIAGALRTVLRLLIAVAMAGVAVAVLVGSHLHTFSKPSSPAPPPRLPAQPSGKPLPAAGSGGAGLDIPLRPILYALLVIALLAALGVSIWWARRVSRVLAAPLALPDADEGTSEELREAVASGRAAMAALDDARAAIIACYEAMEQRLARRGAARTAAGTPDELLRQATDRKIITGTGARQLTTLFYEARFSTHELGPGTRDAAIAALDDLAAELAGSEPEDVATGGHSE
jgi:Domain of unknown function (DUF4129)